MCRLQYNSVIPLIIINSTILFTINGYKCYWKTKCYVLLIGVREHNKINNEQDYSNIYLQLLSFINFRKMQATLKTLKLSVCIQLQKPKTFGDDIVTIPLNTF